VQVPSVEAPAYLEWLTRRFADLGGRLAIQRVDRLADLEERVVVDCAGTGAAALVGDDALTPVRGQVAYVRPDRPLRFMIDETGPNALAYVLPRPDVVVLGGTAEEGDTDLTPREETTKEILAKTRRLQPELAFATFVGAAVGLRPARPQVRLEGEETEAGQFVVHDYGHGGSGFTLSWGCADEVAATVSALT
jgi:D-amino-acid oxidase